MSDFLGTGWSYPPTFSKAKGTVEMTVGEEDINRSLDILLSTRLGERIMAHKYGCNLNDLNFEPLNTNTQTFISGLVEEAIAVYEPRIVADNIEIRYTRHLEGVVEIIITYTIAATNNRFNYVYPFYLEEGTFVDK